jgi:protein AATF/BFR2
VKTSRKKLQEISDGEEEESDEDEEEVEEGIGSQMDDDDESEKGLWNEGAPSESEEDEEINSEAEEEERTPRQQTISLAAERKGQEELPQATATEDLTNILQKTREEDLKKGKAVIRQMVCSWL